MGDISLDPRPQPLEWAICGQLDLLIEPLKGCKGLYAHRQNLLQRVMRMPDLEVRDHPNRLKTSDFPGT